MPSQTNERALEALIEKVLTGSSREERQAMGALRLGETPISSLGAPIAYEWGESSGFDKQLAIDTDKFWQFLQLTQHKELAKLHDRPNWSRLLLERIDKKLKKDGILKLLKDGVAIDDATFTPFYSPPANHLNPLIAQRYASNIFSVTRQVHYSQAAPHDSIDMVIFVNGLPVATIELKNQWTGQTVSDAMSQYEQRDTSQTLLNFGRCVVHFAVDTDEVWMTTKLNGKKTFFLPFNKGHNFGKGNPPNPHGHRSAYLWDEVLQRDSLANILQHFTVLIGKKKSDKLKQKTLYFPRYHQLDVVRRLLAHAREHGSGHTYLIQHSAGSGKSHSITWAAYQLIELYAKTPPPSLPHWGKDQSEEPLFNSVIVVTDRRVLDKQLKKNIGQFSAVKNIVAHAGSSADLKQHLESGKKIIISTIQKFPFIVDGIEDLSDKRFAVIIDEAHSSQSGISADKLSMTISTDNEEDEPDDVQDNILRAMKGRKLGRNASFFAFTATPKNATLEKFGERQANGSFQPFHLYSMKQAIEEGFILDVLANYTTYQSYYELEKSIRDNPLFDTAKAQKKLRAYVEGHAETIAVKATIIVDHFLQQVVATKKLKGQARGMVVTRNITTAIRYYHAIRDALKAANASCKAIVAFSGKKTVDGIEYSEESCNGFPSKDIEKEFDGDEARPAGEYRLLVVANKFLTGFDQPKLNVMYIDKKLQGLTAVQAISRLNRSAAAFGKRPEDLFVLDFYNSTNDIKAAFDPFYTSTTLSSATDVNVLHDLKEALDDVGVYEQHEVDAFIDLYFGNAPADRLSPIIDVCADRFNHELELEDEDKVDFKIKAKQFVKIYAQVAALLPFNLVAWEKLYWFLKFLIPKLKVNDPQSDALDALLNSVDLSTYGLERSRLGVSIGLDSAESELDPANPNPRGVHGDDVQRDPLDEIIQQFNERFATDWAQFGGITVILNMLDRMKTHPQFEAQVVNNPDAQNRRIAIEDMVGKAMNERRRDAVDLYKRFVTDDSFKQAFIMLFVRVLEQGLEGHGKVLPAGHA